MSQIARKKFTRKINVLLPLIFTLEFFSSVILEFEFLFNILAVLILIFIYLQLLLIRSIQKFDIFFIFISLLFIIVSLDVTRISILCVFILFSIRDFFNQRTILNCLFVTLICIAIIIFCYIVFGFNRQYDSEIFRPFMGTTVKRMCFGFVHPNQFTIYLLAFTILVYLSTNKFIIYILITLIDFLFFNLTQSRTVIYVVLFIFVAISVVKFFKVFQKHKVNKRIALVILFFFIAISLILSLFFAGSKLDVLLTGRLTLNKKYLENGLTLFGDNSYDALPFDNSYVHMLLTKGLIYSIVYCALFGCVLLKTRFSWENLIYLVAIFLEAFMEVIFLKYCFLIIIPLICSNRIMYKNDTKKDSLLLVRECAEV